MSNYTVLIGLEKEGMLDVLIRRGIVSLNHVMYTKIFTAVSIQLEDKDVPKMVAYQNVADKFGVSVTTVRDAIRWCNL